MTSGDPKTQDMFKASFVMFPKLNFTKVYIEFNLIKILCVINKGKQ